MRGLGQLGHVCGAEWWEGRGGFCSHRFQALAALESGLGLLGSWLQNQGPVGLPGQEAARMYQLLPLHFLGPYSTHPDSQHPYLAEVSRRGQKAA